MGDYRDNYIDDQFIDIQQGIQNITQATQANGVETVRALHDLTTELRLNSLATLIAAGSTNGNLEICRAAQAEWKRVLGISTNGRAY